MSIFLQAFDCTQYEYDVRGPRAQPVGDTPAMTAFRRTPFVLVSSTVIELGGDISPRPSESGRGDRPGPLTAEPLRGLDRGRDLTRVRVHAGAALAEEVERVLGAARRVLPREQIGEDQRGGPSPPRHAVHEDGHLRLLALA